MKNTLTIIVAPRAPRVRCVAGGWLLAAGALAAGLTDAAAQGASAPAPSSGKEYTLTKSSSFDAPAADARNPFWPVGWVPGPAVAATQAAVVYDVRPEMFVLTTTSVDYPPLAIINGRSYAVGDLVPVPGGPENVRVKTIKDGTVVLDHRGREMRIQSSLGKGRQ